MKKPITIFILILFCVQVFAQTKSQFKKQLKTATEDMRKEKQANVFAFDQFCKAIPNVVIEETEVYMTDTIAAIRRFIVQLVNMSGINSEDSLIRRTAVDKQSESFKDEDHGIRSLVSGYLKRYNKNDFSDEAKQQFSEVLEYDHSYYQHVVQLVAYLDMEEETGELQGLLSDTTHNDPKIKWKVHTALARLGVKESIDYCVNYVKSKDMNDLLVRFVLSDLAYIKQAETIGYLVSELYNNEKNCRAANPNSSGKITCAYRIMEMLAPVVKGYPYQAKYGTQLEAPSYEKALKDIRKWFSENEDYEINREIF